VNTPITLRTAFIAVLLVAGGAAHAGSTVATFVAGDVVAKPCSAPVELSGLDARVVAKASQGVSVLRQYVWITRGIYGLDMTDTVAWLDEQRAARATCVADVSSVASR
jgi:hypothetical protein